MNKTVLITGCSSGIGRATASFFLKKNWNVVIGLLEPEKEIEFKNTDKCILIKLDVCNTKDIKAAIEKTKEKFGGLNVLINNAGYALRGKMIESDLEEIKQQFDTNLWAIIELMKCTIPLLKNNKDACIINISSVGGQIIFPEYSAYNSSKWALEGYSEAIQQELLELGIKIKLIEPGAINTNFYTNKTDKTKSIIQENMEYIAKNSCNTSTIAKTIFKAANSKSNKLRYPVGGNARLLIIFRKISSPYLFNRISRYILSHKNLASLLLNGKI